MRAHMASNESGQTAGFRSSVFREDLFAGQVIVVSGGGTGIGKATARELARLGATVVLASRARGHLEETRDAIRAAGGQAEYVRLNLRDRDSVQALFDTVLDRYGHIDGLVNNGGGQFLKAASEIDPAGLHAVVETNLYGTLYMCQAAFTRAFKDRGGAIVNMAMDNWRGMPMAAHSAAARAGVVNLTQTLALEWAQYGVRVNAVAPGIIESSGLRNYGPTVLALLHRAARDLPPARLGTEDEVAAAIIFLLSPAAAYISGETLKIDGASSLYRLPGFAIADHTAWPSYVTTQPVTEEPIV